jgi:predicted enzyme related to lactoylglutathione lyase
MNLPDAPIAEEGFYVTHCVTVADQERSAKFLCSRAGLQSYEGERPVLHQAVQLLAHSEFRLRPTLDKPQVFLTTPQDPNTFSSFLSPRVDDIAKCYREWKAAGAEFLAEPWDNQGWERRCYMRDPDGYMIEVGQHTQASMERFREFNR